MLFFLYLYLKVPYFNGDCSLYDLFAQPVVQLCFVSKALYWYFHRDMVLLWNINTV